MEIGTEQPKQPKNEEIETMNKKHELDSKLDKFLSTYGVVIKTNTTSIDTEDEWSIVVPGLIEGDKNEYYMPENGAQLKLNIREDMYEQDGFSLMMKTYATMVSMVLTHLAKEVTHAKADSH